MVTRAVEINLHGGTSSPTKEWQFVSTRGLPHPSKEEQFIIYTTLTRGCSPWASPGGG